MSDMFGPAMLAVTSSIQAFQGMLPRLSEVRKANPQDNPDIAADVRMGEVASAALAMGVGVIASSLTQSPLPAVTGLVMVAILIAVYESALRANRPFEGATVIPLLRTEEANA